jgi:hypothetical protein
MNKKKVLISILIVAPALLAVISFLAIRSNNQRLRACPQAWYDNQMPGPRSEGESSRQYFVYDGKRKELGEVDIEWVKSNCSVNNPQEVY